MTLNPVVWVTPYQEEQDRATKAIHEAFEKYTSCHGNPTIDMIAYRSDGKIVVGRNFVDVDERTYEYDTLDPAWDCISGLYDMTGYGKTGGKIPDYDPSVHVDVLLRLNQRCNAGKSKGRFLAYAFVRKE